MTSALLLALLAAEPAGRIEGQVLHALTGEPVAKVTVTVQSDNPFPWGASVLSNATGHFAFDKLTPGIYGLHAAKSGFLSRRHANRQGKGDLPAIKVVDGEALPPATLWLHPSATLGGKVLDEDSEPMDSVLVTAWRRNFLRGKANWIRLASSHTNAAGEFVLSDLEPGVYYVSAETEATRKGRRQFPVRIGDREFAYQRTYYPNAKQITDAQPFHLRAGQNDNSLLIQLRREPVSRLEGRFAATADPPHDVYGYLRRIPEGAHAAARLESATQYFQINPSNGAFSVPGLNAGNYEICVAANGPGPTRVRGRVRLHVSGAPVEHVEIPPLTLLKLRVAVGFEERQPKSADHRPRLSLHLDNFDFPNGPSQNLLALVEDGAISFPSLLPADYNIAISHFPVLYYIKSIRLNGEAKKANPVLIPEASEAEMQILLSDRMATFQAQVETASGDAPLGTLVIEPESFEALNYLDIQEINLPPDRAYQSPKMPPGAYYLYAFAEADPSLVRDPAYLKLFRKHATKLILGEDETKSVTLRQIPASLTMSDSTEGPRP